MFGGAGTGKNASRRRKNEHETIITEHRLPDTPETHVRLTEVRQIHHGIAVGLVVYRLSNYEEGEGDSEPSGLESS